MRGREPTADCTAAACTSRRVHEQPRARAATPQPAGSRKRGRTSCVRSTVTSRPARASLPLPCTLVHGASVHSSLPVGEVG